MEINNENILFLLKLLSKADKDKNEEMKGGIFNCLEEMLNVNYNPDLLYKALRDDKEVQNGHRLFIIKKMGGII